MPFGIVLCTFSSLRPKAIKPLRVLLTTYIGETWKFPQRNAVYVKRGDDTRLLLLICRTKRRDTGNSTIVFPGKRQCDMSRGPDTERIVCFHLFFLLYACVYRCKNVRAAITFHVTPKQILRRTRISPKNNVHGVSPTDLLQTRVSILQINCKSVFTICNFPPTVNANSKSAGLNPSSSTEFADYLCQYFANELQPIANRFL